MYNERMMDCFDITPANDNSDPLSYPGPALAELHRIRRELMATESKALQAGWPLGWWRDHRIMLEEVRVLEAIVLADMR